VKVVLFGSGGFGIPTLGRLRSLHGRIDLVRLVSRPDRPRGRGREVAPTPLRARAIELGVPCDAPETANDPAYLETLAALAPDLFVVVDYGEMLRKPLRALPRIGVFNLHGSLLPRYRGAAPVARALLAGEETTGVTLFRVDRELDAGPIVDVVEARIEPIETAGELEARLSILAADLIERNLEAFRSGAFRETRQDDSLVTYAPRLEKSEGLIEWDADPPAIANRVRALNPWPTAWSFLRKEGRRPERTSFLRVRPVSSSADSSLSPGSVEVVRRDGFSVRCRGGAVDVLELKREGGTALDAASYLRGRPLRLGDRFAAS